MMKIDIDIENGTMELDTNFLIDFGSVKNGPFCPHEMRYSNGDCTSDIFN